jgi:TRAP-type mannitol/chloroaromatic compound transport system permease small subunit
MSRRAAVIVSIRSGVNGRARRSGGGIGLDTLLAISRAIDRLSTAIGRTVMWLILVAVVISTVNAIIRKAFDVSSNMWLEMQWQLFGCVFMLAAGYTLLANEHIRIDIVNSRFPKAVRNWIELIGHGLFLLPFTILMMVDGWPFFWRSYLGNEQSFNAGGLPQWPAKLLVPVGFFLLFLQAVSEIIKRLAVMRGRIPDPHDRHDEVPEGSLGQEII